MANEFVQTMSDARVDARSLSDFVFKPAGFKVPRRLAPPIDTLQFYIDSFDAYIATIPNIVNDAINNTAVEGGVLADTFVTATANGVGSVARTQRDKNSDTVHINDFIDPASIPTDYWQAFTNAFQYLQGIGGGKLTLDFGKVYRIERPLLLPTTLTLDMNNSTLQKCFGENRPDANGYPRASLCTFYNDSAKDVSIYGGFLDGNGQNYFHGHNLIGWRYGSNVKIEAVGFKNGVIAHAIDIGSSTDVLINFCTFRGYANDISINPNIFIEAIQLDPQPNNASKTSGVTITNCYCGGSDGANTDPRFGGYPVFVGNHFASGSDMYFRNITISNNTVVSANYAAIRPYAWEQVVIENNLFTDCKLGVHLSTGVGNNLIGCKEVVIKHNTMKLSAVPYSSGVLIDAPSEVGPNFKHKNIHISGNTISGGVYGMRVFNCDNLFILNNTIQSTAVGISTGGTLPQKNHNYIGNIITSPSSMYVTGEFSSSSIKSNTCDDVTDRALYITGQGGSSRKNIKIADNIIYASTISNLIEIDGGASSGVYVDGNTFSPANGLPDLTPNSLVRMQLTGGFNYCNNNVVDENFSNSPYLLGNGIPVKGMIHKNPEGFVEAGQGSRLIFKKYNYYEEFAKTTNSGSTGWVART